MKRALTGIVAVGVVLAAPGQALAKKPVDFRADAGESGVALEKAGLTLSARCSGSASEPFIEVFARSAGRAQLTASMSEAGSTSPITVHKPRLRPEQRVPLAQSKDRPIAGTLSYTDSDGGQVSATFHLDAVEVMGGAYDCFLGGTSLKNTAIDYRADVGSKPRTFRLGDTRLRASCTGTSASPELDLTLRGSQTGEVGFGASWSQAGNPTALTTFDPAPTGPVDPLVGLEDAAAGTMVLFETSIDSIGTLVFHSDEGRGILGSDCLFGGTFTQPSQTVGGLGTFLNNDGSSRPVFTVEGFRGRLTCSSTDSVLGLSSGISNAPITASYSIVGVPEARTIHDPDGDFGDPRLDQSAEGDAAVGTASFSAPDGTHVTANFANVFIPGEGCLVSGTATSIG